MPVDCLVCGKPTSATHMGMDACRACTVFYRRNRDSGDKLLCINGNRACMDYGKNVFSCRKCRLTRFEAVMRAGSGEDLSPASSVISRTPVDQKPAEFDRMMQQLINTPPRTPGNSIIERIRVNLQALSAFRCAGEMKLRGTNVNPSEASGDNYPLIPCTYQFMEDATKILIPGLFEFSQLTFPDFQMLSHSDKWILIRNFEKIFHCLDGEMRTRRRFGRGSFHVFGTYTSFMSLDGEHFFSDCPDQSSVATAAKTFQSWLEEHVPKVKQQLFTIDPSEDEFLALIGLAIWSVENIDASDELLAIASRNRTEIVVELTAHYRCTIGTERGASRIGTLMCLLQEFRRAVMTMGSDYQIYLMLGAFDENTLMCKLPVS